MSGEWSWNSGPVPVGADVQSWAFISQYYYALDERYSVVQGRLQKDPDGTFNALNCCGNFPRSQTVWGNFTVSAATNTTITPDAMPEKCGGVNPVDHDWTSGCSGITAVPTSWDIVIDDCDPQKVVRAHVVSNNDSTFTITTLADYVTSKFLPSLSSLVGKEAFLIKANGPWWSERWMQWGNDMEYARGSVSSVVVDPDDGTKQLLTCTGKNWKTNSLAVKDLLVYGDDSRLHRVIVISNTADTIKYAKQTWTPSGTFVVVKHDGKADP